MASVAVLLIIGAAVIGPIEGHSCISMKDAGPEQFARACIAITVAELCARAMKEIGADDLLIAGKHGGWYGQLDDHTPVRCVPVPEGYRR